MTEGLSAVAAFAPPVENDDEVLDIGASFPLAVANANEDLTPVMQQLYKLSSASATAALFHHLIEVGQGESLMSRRSLAEFLDGNGKILPEVKIVLDRYYPSKQELYVENPNLADMYCGDYSRRSAARDIPDQEQRKHFLERLAENLGGNAQPSVGAGLVLGR